MINNLAAECRFTTRPGLYAGSQERKFRLAEHRAAFSAFKIKSADAHGIYCIFQLNSEPLWHVYICIDMYFHILSLELRFCDELIRSRLVLTVFGLGEKGLAAKVRLTFMG